VLDSRITLSDHTKAISKSCFYHIHALRHIRGSLDHLTIRTIAAALVSTRLDYANSILYGIPAKYISRLQRTHNTLARFVTANDILILVPHCEGTSLASHRRSHQV